MQNLKNYSLRLNGAGRPGPDSDLDLLVIKSGNYNPRIVAGDLYMKLYGVSQPVDLNVVTLEQVQEYGNSPYLVLHPALHEGEVHYDARTASTRVIPGSGDTGPQLSCDRPLPLT